MVCSLQRMATRSVGAALPEGHTLAVLVQSGVVKLNGGEVARGLIAYDAIDAVQIAGRASR